MKRVVVAAWLDNLYRVERLNRKTNEWEQCYSTHHEDSAHREAFNLTGQVRIIYPDGTAHYMNKGGN